LKFLEDESWDSEYSEEISSNQKMKRLATVLLRTTLSINQLDISCEG